MVLRLKEPDYTIHGHGKQDSPETGNASAARRVSRGKTERGARSGEWTLRRIFAEGWRGAARFR